MSSHRQTITITLHRRDFESKFGFKFTDEKWELFKDISDQGGQMEEMLDDVIDENEDVLLEVPLEDNRHFEGYGGQPRFRPAPQIVAKEYWASDKYWEEQQEKLLEKSKKLFALKIEKYYLDAKYNPRTPIGKKFANALYDENFNE
tara:strand:+ start:128 stop:565 length:438 start_codon:yes stop_codon:yes gene_type:complete